MTIRTHLEIMRLLGIEVAQDWWEFAQFMAILRERKPKSLLEIGTREGGSLWMMGQTLPVGGRIVSVDLIGGPWGRATSGRKRAVVAELLRFQRRSVELIDGDSKAATTVERVRAAMPASGFDVIFIDGDHTEAAVRRDWELYGPLCAQGGIVALHDIRSRRVGVWKLWNDLAQWYPHREIYRRFGIGVIYC